MEQFYLNLVEIKKKKNHILKKCQSTVHALDSQPDHGRKKIALPDWGRVQELEGTRDVSKWKHHHQATCGNRTWDLKQQSNGFRELMQGTCAVCWDKAQHPTGCWGSIQNDPLESMSHDRTKGQRQILDHVVLLIFFSSTSFCPSFRFWSTEYLLITHYMTGAVTYFVSGGANEWWAHLGCPDKPNWSSII